MDKTVPCFCNKKRIDPENSDYVLRGMPICSEECLRKAEAYQPKKKTEWEFNGA